MSQTSDQIPYEALAERFGTPLYVYNADELTRAHERYRQAFAGLDPLICYAVKANSNLSILRHFAQLGCGFDIVSGGELARVIAAGGDPAKTVFSGVGKSRDEIRDALEAGIKCFNIESLPEIDRIEAIAAISGHIAPVSLRINPNINAQTHPYISTGLRDNKFGIAIDQAEEAYRYAASRPHLRVVGIDCHIGSQLLDLSPLEEACARILELADRLEAAGIRLEHIDLGGGIGIVYDENSEREPDLTAYAQTVSRLLSSRSLKLLLEPGRSLCGNAGVLLTRVEYHKRHHGKNFLIVDAAMNDLMRPALYQAYHRIETLTRRGQPEITADIVGPVCESSDFFAKDRTIAATEGDLLLIHSAGAYASSMASNYNTRPRAAEVLVENGQARLIRHRENIKAMLAAELPCL